MIIGNLKKEEVFCNNNYSKIIINIEDIKKLVSSFKNLNSDENVKKKLSICLNLLISKNVINLGYAEVSYDVFTFLFSNYSDELLLGVSEMLVEELDGLDRMFVVKNFSNFEIKFQTEQFQESRNDYYLVNDDALFVLNELSNVNNDKFIKNLPLLNKIYKNVDFDNIESKNIIIDDIISNFPFIVIDNYKYYKVSGNIIESLYSESEIISRKFITNVICLDTSLLENTKLYTRVRSK